MRPLRFLSQRNGYPPRIDSWRWRPSVASYIIMCALRAVSYVETLLISWSPRPLHLCVLLWIKTYAFTEYKHRVTLLSHGTLLSEPLQIDSLRLPPRVSASQSGKMSDSSPPAALAYESHLLAFKSYRLASAFVLCDLKVEVLCHCVHFWSSVQHNKPPKRVVSHEPRAILSSDWKVCLHVTFFSPCPLLPLLLFIIVSMVTVWIADNVGDRLIFSPLFWQQ